jgi:hypothetical protein
MTRDARYDYPESRLAFWDEHLSYVALCLNVEIGTQIQDGDPKRTGPFIEALRDVIRLVHAEDQRRKSS